MKHATHADYCKSLEGKRWKAEVIEVYPAKGEAAIKFRWQGRDRIECVTKAGMAPEFTVGMRGWITYIRTLNGYGWGFEPAKGQED